MPTQVVSSDDCRARICDDPTNQLVTGEAFELWRFIIRTRLWLGRLTVADATNLHPGDRKWLVKTAQKYDFHSAAILFDIPLETALRRNAARSRKVPEDAVVRQFDSMLETLLSIRHERFDDVFILNQDEQDTAAIVFSTDPART